MDEAREREPAVMSGAPLSGLAEDYAKAVHENYRKKRLFDARRKGCSQEEIAAIMQEDNMADWDHLKECYKMDSRNQIMYLAQRFLAPHIDIGIRPTVEGAHDTVDEICGQILEILAEAEHERWVRNKLEDGWIYGARDNELKHHPDLVPYDQLSETMKDYDRQAIRNIPGYLRQIGYELYKKEK